jgi:hypothetical protein
MSSQLKDIFNKELSKFFDLPLINIDIYSIESRIIFNKIMGFETKAWMVGFTKANTVYILAENKFEIDSSRLKSDYPLILKHEMSHIYYSKLNCKGLPNWLDEGTACFIAGQNKNIPIEPITIDTLIYYHDKHDEKIYAIGRYLVE